jgi:Family of unknown function (DUF5677)
LDGGALYKLRACLSHTFQDSEWWVGRFISVPLVQVIFATLLKCFVEERFMSAIRILTRDEYHLSVLEKVKALTARLGSPSLFVSEKERDKVLCYFMRRAMQIGEACFRIADLEMPFSCLARVLCEDFFRMYWATLSEQNASEYSKAAKSEMAKMLKFNLKNKHARVSERGKDVTQRFLPQIEARITKTRTVREMAEDAKLGSVYDIVFRFDSLEVHGNTYGWSELPQEIDGVGRVLSAINAFLRAMLYVADHQDKPPSAQEIMAVLNIRHIPGT